MKRLLFILLTLVFALSLFGCGKESVPTVPLEDADLSNIDFSGQNLNNCYSSNTEFQTNGEVYFYTAYNGLKSTLNIYYNGEHAVLVDQADWEEEILDYQYYINGNTLYFATFVDLWDENEELEATAYNFYRFDLSAKSYELLCTVNDISRWMVAGEHIIYLKDYDDEYGLAALHCYDPASRTDVCVAAEIEDFGIAAGKVRYISHSENYSITDYDPVSGDSAIVGSFEGYSSKEYVSYNFTSDCIVMLPNTTNESRDDTELSVYSISGNTYCTYTLPVYTYQLIAAEQYAYIDGYESSDDDQSNCVYRIDLANGQWEKLDMELGLLSNLYVASDDILYTCEYKSILVMLSKTEVVRHDLKNGTSEVVFAY